MLLAFPTIVLGIVILVALGSGVFNVVIALTVAFVPRFIRLVRAETLTIKEKNFVEAARAAGASDGRIMLALHPAERGRHRDRERSLVDGHSAEGGGNAQLSWTWGATAISELGQHDVGGHRLYVRQRKPRSVALPCNRLCCSRFQSCSATRSATTSIRA